jgi:hypothetical protein
MKKTILTFLLAILCVFGYSQTATEATQKLVYNKLNTGLTTSGTTSVVSLPTSTSNLATSALQTTGNSTASSINSKFTNMYGNTTSSTLSHTIIETTTPAALTTAIGDFFSNASFPTIVDIQYSSYGFFNVSNQLSYSVLIFYR